MAKDYDYLLKVLLVGDSDVGKHEIMAGLEDGSTESPFCSGSGNCKKFNFYSVKRFSINRILDIQHTKRPRFCLMENVSNFSYGTHLDRVDFAQLSDRIRVAPRASFSSMTSPTNGALTALDDG